AVVGTFNGLPEGTTVTINSVNFRLTYHGGDGNDIVLTTAAAADTYVTLVGGNLTITDINSVSDDTLTIQSDTANSRFIISDPNHTLTTDIPGATGNLTNTIYVPFSAVTGSSINVFTLDGNDSLTLDYALGNFSKLVNDDAGTGTDTLNLIGGTFASVTHTFNALDAAYDASTAIFGGAGTDSITQLANLTLGSLLSIGNLTYQAETIALNGSLHSPATATYDTGNSVNSFGVSESAGAAVTA